MDYCVSPFKLAIRPLSSKKGQKSNVKYFFLIQGLYVWKKSVFLPPISDRRSVSSVGLERLLDRQEVTGSNPVQITKLEEATRKGVAFFCCDELAMNSDEEAMKRQWIIIV